MSSRPRAQVYSVKHNGWCTGRVIKGSGDACIDDTIVFQPKYRFGQGDIVVAKVVPNGKGVETWFATFAEPYRPRETRVAHEGWQDGDEFIAVPDTMPGSPHDGIEFECWTCGHAKVHHDQIHRVKQTAIWTNTNNLDGCTIRPKVSWNKWKQCNVQSVECSHCHDILGSYYAEPYIDSDTGRIKDGQPFPCFKLDHMRTQLDRSEKRTFSLVLTGRNADVKSAIAQLITTDQADLVKPFAKFGRIDASAFEMLKQHKAKQLEVEKERQRAAEEAEQERRQAQAAAAETKRQAVKEAEKKRRQAAAEADAIKRAAAEQAEQKQRDAEQAERRLHQAERDVEAARGKATDLIKEAEDKWKLASEVERSAEAQAAQRRRDADRAALEAAKTAEEAAALRAQAQAEAMSVKARAAEEAERQRHEAQALIAEAELRKKTAKQEQQAARQALKNAEEEATRSLVAPLPSYWTRDLKPTGPGVHVDVSTTMRERLQWLMNKTARPDTHGSGRDSHGCTFNKFSVVSVERIDNFKLWQSYATKRAQIHAASGAKISDVPTTQMRLPYGVNANLDLGKNEFYLFHGTPNGNVADFIKKDGFDFRVCSTEGMLGQGLYFADSASKSDQYTGQGADLYMFLARVVVGTPHCTNTRRGFRRPPCVQGCLETQGCLHERTDSVFFSSPAKNFREFVVYDNAQCYPEYLVRYRRE
eukprot:m.76445 g.76445  ORF g.76445 m.76445 type:complete len:702 (-) comp9062_c0_seq1:278-2383(-)